MTRVNSATPTAKLPKPPRDPQAPKKADKSFLARLIERTTRTIKQVNEVQLRTKKMDAVDGLSHPEHGKAVRIVSDSADEAVEALHEVLTNLSELSDAGYEPSIKGGRATLAVGSQVWLRGAVWVRKYQALYTPEELDGLQIVAVSGKIARAKADSGVQFAEPVGSFTTHPVSYEAAGSGQTA
jgi:hypothetical protein